MTPLREKEMLQAKRVGLQTLLRDTPHDPMARAPLEHGIHKIETRLKELEAQPSINPQAEMFFVDGKVTNHHGLEITFAADMLKSYQNMVTNHYAAKHYTLLRVGRRHGEAEAHLFLTALPRGSFGMQLSQPQITDWVAAANVSAAMVDLSNLVDAAADSDDAFDGLLAQFNPRVLKPLTSFMATLNAGGGSFRLVTGMKQVRMNREKIHEAYLRVSAASSVEHEITIPGTFGGITGYTWEFDFQPHAGDVIHGPIANDVTEEEAERMNHDFMFKPAFATLKETTVTTRSGKKRPTFELIRLMPTKEAPPIGQAPATIPPKESSPARAGKSVKVVQSPKGGARPPKDVPPTEPDKK
jgi:hypothetical protein